MIDFDIDNELRRETLDARDRGIDTRIDLEEALVNALNVDDFRKWLEAHDPQEVAGYTCAAMRCPAANYLRDAHNLDASVGSWSAAVVDDDGVIHEIESPEMFRLFVDGVDMAGSGFDKPVTYGECLAVLEAVAA